MPTRKQIIEELQAKMFACCECNQERDGANLFLLELSQIARIKGEKEGKEHSRITPDDLPEFARCWECFDKLYPEEKNYYSLAESIASAQAYKAHQQHGKHGASKRALNARLQSTVTIAEAKELVTCFYCEEFYAEVRKLPRGQMQAPGWLGCNILKADRLGIEITDLKDPRVYVSSEDLLKDGNEGFNTCPDCIDELCEELVAKARKFGVSEAAIDRGIRPLSLVAMILGVRRKEEKEKGRAA